MPAIKLVRNDTAPQLKLSFTDDCSCTPTDITGATVTLHMREAYGTELLFSRQAVVLQPATNGEAVVVWLPGDLDLEPGEYEGEVEVVFPDGVRETIYDTLQFVVREEFA